MFVKSRQGGLAHEALCDAPSAFEFLEALGVEVVRHGQIVIGTEDLRAGDSAVQGQRLGLAHGRRYSTTLLFEHLVILVITLVESKPPPLILIEQNLREKCLLDVIKIPTKVAKHAENGCETGHEGDIHDQGRGQVDIEELEVVDGRLCGHEGKEHSHQGQADEHSHEVCAELLVHGLAMTDSQVLGKVEGFGEERFCHSRQVHRVDEVSALDQVLKLIDEFHRHIMVGVPALLVIETLILLFLVFQIVSIGCSFFLLTPDADLVLGFAQ